MLVTDALAGWDDDKLRVSVPRPKQHLADQRSGTGYFLKTQAKALGQVAVLGTIVVEVGVSGVD